MSKATYEAAKAQYKKLGIDTEKAINTLKKISISMHCWQGDDVGGFETTGGASGGIQTTGNYPGKARTPQELMADLDFALKLIPGKHRVNLHACYGIHEGTVADRDKIEPKHFAPWVAWAKKRGVGLDFNPTFFSHPLAANGLTLSSPDPKVRAFWVKHGIQCLKIAEYFGKELGTPCAINFWCPDGYKDEPSDRLRDPDLRVEALRHRPRELHRELARVRDGLRDEEGHPRAPRHGTLPPVRERGGQDQLVPHVLR